MQLQEGDSERGELEAGSHVDVHEFVPLENVRVENRLMPDQSVTQKQVV